MKKSMLIEAQDILNSLIIEAENPSAFKDALALMTDSMVTAFEEWEDKYANTGRWQRENSLFAKMRDQKKNPFEGSLNAIKSMTDFIATALCKEDFEGYQGTRVKNNGMGYRQIPSSAIKPEFKQIVSSWSSLQKVCNYAAKNAFWGLYKKYKNAEGVDWLNPDDVETPENRRRYLEYKEQYDKYKKLFDDTPKGTRDERGQLLRGVYLQQFKKAQEMMNYYAERGGERDPKDRYNRWKDKNGKVNVMLLKLDWFFRAKSQEGVWCGAYKALELVDIDENHLGWPIARAIKEGIAKLHQKAYARKQAEDDAWHEEFSRGLNDIPKGSSGNHMVDELEWEENRNRYGRRRW